MYRITTRNGAQKWALILVPKWNRMTLVAQLMILGLEVFRDGSRLHVLSSTFGECVTIAEGLIKLQQAMLGDQFSSTPMAFGNIENWWASFWGVDEAQLFAIEQIDGIDSEGKLVTTIIATDVHGGLDIIVRVNALIAKTT